MDKLAKEHGYIDVKYNQAEGYTYSKPEKLLKLVFDGGNNRHKIKRDIIHNTMKRIRNNGDLMKKYMDRDNNGNVIPTSIGHYLKNWMRINGL